MGLESFSFLAKHAPGFALRGSQIKIITDPKEFHTELCTRAENAKRRITLASLYLGTGQKEQKLVESIHKSLTSTNGSCRVKVLLDFCRGNRIVSGQSSSTMLKPLLSEYSKSCRVAMYHTPKLRGLWKSLLPNKFNEIVGLQHCKIYVFDDSFIISGANLSNDYFTNRQDRYILVKDCPKLADYFDDLISNISDFSLELDDKDSFSISPNWTVHPYIGSLRSFKEKVQSKIFTFIEDQMTENKLEFDSKREKFVKSQSSESYDTWIFPTIQMGQMDIGQDSAITTKLFSSGAENGMFKFGTGYFNITEQYQDVLIHASKSKFNLLMAHPSANGFTGARFPLGGIPYAYTLITNKFYDLITKTDNHNRIKLFEYQRPDWTFHGKGLWYYLPNEKYPSMTQIGSSNYGYRSTEKDLELSMTLVTKNDTLKKSLDEEQKKMFDLADRVSEKTFADPERMAPTWVKAVVGLFRRFF